MNSIEVGMLVKSLSGHDKSELFLVKSIENEYLYLVDGRLRTLEKPKKKNNKHIQAIKEVYNIEEISNVAIKKLIREYKKEHSI